MIAWVRFAFRNLLRNRRRSLYTILAVAIGFAAINIFGGFTEYIFTNLRESFIYVEGNGHLAVFKRGARQSNAAEESLKYMLSNEEVQRVREVAEADARIIGISEVMTLAGLISNGDTTTIYVGLAWVPSEKYAFKRKARGLMSRLEFFDGEPLKDDLEYGIGIGRGLAAKLDRQIGADLILMAPTVHGQINAVDAQVLQVVDTPMELLEDKWVIMPLGLARSLYDTEGAIRVNLLLAQGEDSVFERSGLEEKLRDAGLDVEIVPWRDLSPFYVKVEQMFHIIFFFMFLIVSVIIVMSVINTVSMAVLERSREIGTMRAMGARRQTVVSLFSLEGAFLGLFGCLAGVVILAGTLTMLEYIEPYWTPPQMARSIPFEVYVVPEYLLFSTLFLTILSFASGVFPARRIARLNIVEALGHV